MAATQTTRKRGEPHPVYAGAPAEHQWRGGSLAALFLALRRQARLRPIGPAAAADRAADRDFSWFALPGGAVVGMRRRDDLDERMELRIARREAPQTAAAQAKWQTEVATFLRQWEIVAGDGLTPCDVPGRIWHPEPIVKPADQGKAVVRLVELRHGEVAPGKALCYPCAEAGTKTVVSWFPPGGVRGQRCDRCVGGAA